MMTGSIPAARWPSGLKSPSFGGKRDASPVTIRLGDSVDVHPEENRFIDHWMPDIEKTQRFTRFPRAEVTRAVAERTGLRLLDFGNATDLELAWAYKRLIRFPHTVPPGVTTVVVGHGGGAGKNWHFLGGGPKVADYIARHVPHGEKVWAIVCDQAHKRHFLEGEGTLVVSGVKN